MNIEKRTVCKIFIAMLRADIAQFKALFIGRLIDRLSWVATLTIVMAYFMPAFGLTKAFGPFLLAGFVPSIGILETYSSAAAIVADLEGNRVLSFYLTLPVPPWLVFVRMVLFYALQYAALSFLVIPFGSCLLPNPVQWAAVSWWRLGIIFLLINLFCGVLVVWMASIITSMRVLGKMWSRLIHPAWFVGGFQFSWFVVYDIWPRAAYLFLLNPVVYTMEGMRAAFLGQEGFLPFWLCCVVLLVVSIVLTICAIKNFRKRLDFI